MVPIFVDNHVFLPETTTKSFLFALIIFIVIVVFVVGVIAHNKFRDDVLERIPRLIKNPVTYSSLIFIGIYILAAFLATDVSSAWWGTLSRSEGVMGMLYFTVFFIMTGLLFEKEDWIRFFKFSLLVGVIVLGKEYVQAIGHVIRPGSFIGNAAFLSEYLVFNIFAAWMIIVESTKKGWRVFSGISIILILLGVIIAQTRGTILGIAAGCGAVLLFTAFQGGKQVVYKNISLRTLSLVIILAGVAFSGLFIITRNDQFWQSIPGLSRFAQIGTDDNTTSSRLIVWQTSIGTVSPHNESIKKLLIGWGPENFYLAFEKYYNPAIFSDDVHMFDRPHNKLIEELVTTGIIGLIAYIAIWIFLLRAIYQIPDFKTKVGLYFISIAYLVHLMFLFDVIVTSIGFMMLLSVVVVWGNRFTASNHKDKILPIGRIQYIFIGGISIATLLMVYFFFAGTLSGYVRMHKYVGLVSGASASTASKQVPELLSRGGTYIDSLIVGDFLNGSAKQYNAQRNAQLKDLLDTSIILGDSYIKKTPNDYRLIVTMINALNSRGDKDSLVLAEKYINTLMSQSPGFPRYTYMLALNYGYQKRFDEAVGLFEKVIATSPESAMVDYQYGWIWVMKGPKYYDRALDWFERGMNLSHDLFEKDYDKDMAMYKVFSEYFTWIKDPVRLQLVNNRIEQERLVHSQKAKK
jgi:O-antigen ligase